MTVKCSDDGPLVYDAKRARNVTHAEPGASLICRVRGFEKGRHDENLDAKLAE
jgi:hypothetical protein